MFFSTANFFLDNSDWLEHHKLFKMVHVIKGAKAGRALFDDRGALTTIRSAPSRNGTHAAGIASSKRSIM